ncbi:MAG: hypothetical protein R3F37_17945 [Candidatus Competibacteraceae bacterium]
MCAFEVKKSQMRKGLTKEKVLEDEIIEVEKLSLPEDAWGDAAQLQKGLFDSGVAFETNWCFETKREMRNHYMATCYEQKCLLIAAIRIIPFGIICG